MPFEFTDGLGQISDWSGSGSISLDAPIIPDGIGSTAAIGDPPVVTVSIDLSGVGIPPTSGVGSGLAVDVLPAEKIATIYIAGVDVTDLAEAEGGGKSGIQRSMRLGGGSKATCQFTLNNKHGEITMPAAFDEVLVWTRDEDGNVSKFFGGKVDKLSGFNYSGTSNLTRVTVTCVDYGCLLDDVVVGHEFQSNVGNDPTILTYQLAIRYFAEKGINYVFTGFPPKGGLGDVIFNWVSGTDAMNRIANDSGGNWRIDFHKNLYLFGGDGYTAAPFSIAQDDGKWRNLTVDRDMSRYRNRIYAKTTQNTKPLWTDTFTTAAGEFVWQTMGPLGNDKPIVRLNGTPKVVVKYEEIGTKPYDFYWFYTTVNSNPASLPSPGSTLEVTYLSPLSDVAIAEDADGIAEHGLREAVETIPDVPNHDALQAWADALLDRRSVIPTTVRFETDVYGLECGMAIPVNVPRSDVNGTFIITDVSTSEQAKKFWRHQITAMDVTSQIGDEIAYMKALQAKVESHRDRVMEEVHFQLAETIPGVENPGLSTDAQFAARSCPVDGILHSCILDFNSHGTPPTTDSEIDVLQDGVSIFGTEKLIWAAGTISVQTKIDFRADPMECRKGDLFTIEIVTADPLNHDGTLTILVVPR